MTISQEIEQAMEKGASTMFLIGLLRMYENAPASTLKQIARAGERLRKRKDKAAMK